ncbi:CbiQ family ECF transporter T component [Micrococcus terreus]|uniref:CbiQ family ECF transporter T component n=1 Tax=Micrococcus terreus TaxID=574650 RepID=UPI0033E4E992
MTTFARLFDHRPGSSPVHRAPLGLKYLVVLAVTVLVVSWRAPLVALAALAVVVVLHGAAGLIGEFLAPLRRLWPLLLVVGLARWISEVWVRPAGQAAGPDVGAAVLNAGVVVVGVYAALTAARLLLLTTPGPDLLDGMERFFGLFRPLGVHPQAAALAVNVMVRSIPWVGTAVEETSEALAARGVRRTPQRLMLPVLVATVGYARATGEALVARGLPDEPEHRHQEDTAP